MKNPNNLYNQSFLSFMRFAHMADCHIGGWRDPKMQELTNSVFSQAIDTCIEKKVDFVIIAGDLFNSAVPAIDSLKLVFFKLDELRTAGIPLYYIPGSHDYSPSGKTMLDLIEISGLGKNVMDADISEDGSIYLNFTVDEKTGVKLAGLYGKKGGLEKDLLKKIDKSYLEKEEGYKIFLFHTAITELKTKDLQKMESTAIETFPKGFDYYAGGHVHIIAQEKRDYYKNVIYPGPLFPNSFSELEKLGQGGFFIVEDDVPLYVPLRVKKHLGITVDCSGKDLSEIEDILYKKAEQDLKDVIVTIRLTGKLSEGKASDLRLKDIFRQMYLNGAYAVMRNLAKLQSKEMDDIEVSASSTREIEDEVIAQIAKKEGSLFSKEKIHELMVKLSAEQNDGEKKYEFEERVKKDAFTILNIEK
jgi:DNA repair protein SbcD/Mre11